MWFAKWFGGRDEPDDDTDEPARFAAPEVTRTSRTETRRPDVVAGKPVAGKKGFDPYNSGSFQRRNAWERINRR